MDSTAMHQATALRDRYLQGSSSPGEINAIARVYAELRTIPFAQALEEVHDGLGYELLAGGEDAEALFPWQEVSRSLVPLGRQWINGV
jgi:hypothetical protein